MISKNKLLSRNQKLQCSNGSNSAKNGCTIFVILFAFALTVIYVYFISASFTALNMLFAYIVHIQQIAHEVENI